MKSAGGAAYGKSLKGLGINLLVRNIGQETTWLSQVLELEIIREDQNFAVIGYGSQHFMLHVDASYAENPLLSLLPESGFRGAGIELRLYDTDPEMALARARLAEAKGQGSVLRECSDRPHGLRECYLIDPNGYCWIPSSRLAD
ncbi:MAG: VOC family protein [Nitratireductor sp.]